MSTEQQEQQKQQEQQQQQPFVEGKQKRKRRQSRKEYSYSDSEGDGSYTYSDEDEATGNKFEVDASEYRKFCRWRRNRERRRMNCPYFRSMFGGSAPPEPTQEGVEPPQYKRKRHRRRHFRHMFDEDSFGRSPPPQYDFERPWGRVPCCARDFPHPQRPYFENPWERSPFPNPPQFYGGAWGRKGYPPPPPPQ